MRRDNRKARAGSRVDTVIGVDTHRDRALRPPWAHTAGWLAQVEVEASQGGYEQLLGS